MLLRLPDHVDDVALAEEAARRQIRVELLSPMQPSGGSDRGLLLGYGRLAAERVDEAVNALAEVVGSLEDPPESKTVRTGFGDWLRR